MSKKSSVTQQIVNVFPPDSNIRLDEQSLGFQFVNIIGKEFEDLDRQLQTIGKNYFLGTANLNEIDTVYRVELGNDFEFDVNENNPANPVYTEPTVSGLVGSTWYPVTVSSNNNIESFWYTSVPNRIDSTTTVSGSATVLSATEISNSPIETFDNNPHLPGRLHITLSGGTEYFKLSDNSDVTRGLVVLDGITRQGTREQETVVFLLDDTRTTLKEWQELYSVRVFGITPSDAEISISSARYTNGPYLDHYNLYHSLSGPSIDTFWDLDTTVSGVNVLAMKRHVSEEFTNLVVAQITEKYTVREVELLNESNVNITPVDLAVQPFSDHVWVASADKLYVYNTDMYLPSIKDLNKKNYSSSAIIEIDNYHKVLNDTAVLDFSFVQPAKSIAQHRVYFTKPDATKILIHDGSEIVFEDDKWQFGSLSGRRFRETHDLLLDQRGDWVITLEVVFTDQSTTADQRIVTAHSKTPLVQFDLPFTATGITFDSDQQLWVLDTSGDHRRIDRYTDEVLVDYVNKVAFFHEDYDEVKVTT